MHYLEKVKERVNRAIEGIDDARVSCEQGENDLRVRIGDALAVLHDNRWHIYRSGADYLQFKLPIMAVPMSDVNSVVSTLRLLPSYSRNEPKNEWPYTYGTSSRHAVDALQYAMKLQSKDQDHDR